MNFKDTLKFSLESKDPKYFNDVMKKNIKLLSFNTRNRDKYDENTNMFPKIFKVGKPPVFLSTTASPFGSSTLKYQKYPGDIDLHQIYLANADTINEATHKMAEALKRMVKKLTKKGYVVSEIKAGIDKRYLPLYDKLINERNINRPVMKPDEKEWLSLAAALNGEEINLDKFNNPLIPYNVRKDEYFNYIRNSLILRWTPEEIIMGKKDKNGLTFNLEEVLKNNSHIKIDAIAPIDDFFMEVTNFIFLGYIDKINNELILVNPPGNYISNLKEEINKNANGTKPNYFKAAKRMYALSRYLGGPFEIMAYKLSKILSGDLSQLYQIKSSLAAWLLFKNSIKDPLNNVAFKLYTNSDVERYKNKIRSLLDSNLYSQYIPSFAWKGTLNNFEVEQLIKYIEQILNNKTYELLKINGFMPVPRSFSLLS